MSWQGVVGHDDVVEGFRRALERGRLATSYLFVGPAGVGKRTFALRLAQTLLCQQTASCDMSPCGRCDACQQVCAGTHPDIETVAPPDGKSAIPVELLIGDREHRSREGFCYKLSMKPFMGGRKIGIIDNADALNREGANCLLKTLEEPPLRSLLILISTSPDSQLPTIRSRCQTIQFRPLSQDNLTELLLAGNHVEDRTKAELLARQSDGGMQMALAWADDDLWQFRHQLLGQLGEPFLDSVCIGSAVQAFVDDAGETTVERRNRARLVMKIAEDFYRELLRAVLGVVAPASDPCRDQSLVAAVKAAVRPGLSSETAAIASIDRCLCARQHIDRNANMATLIACWADDLARCWTAA